MFVVYFGLKINFFITKKKKRNKKCIYSENNNRMTRENDEIKENQIKL